MPRLKVCGITDAGFAACAAGRGVDYLGLVFAGNSPRRVTPEKAREIVGRAASANLPHRPPRFVGVFTTQTIDEIAAIASSVRLDVIQLHGEYDDADVTALKSRGCEVWRLFRGNPTCEDAVLLDGRCGNTSGMADWSQVAPLKAAGRRVVLAGRISSANIADAIATGADILDVSSSLETSPGIKSPALLDELLLAITSG